MKMHFDATIFVGMDFFTLGADHGGGVNACYPRWLAVESNFGSPRNGTAQASQLVGISGVLAIAAQVIVVRGVGGADDEKFIGRSTAFQALANMILGQSKPASRLHATVIAFGVKQLALRVNLFHAAARHVAAIGLVFVAI